MFCIYCGRKIDDMSHFCQYCGREVIPSPTVTILHEPNQPNIAPSIIGLALSIIGLALISIIPDSGILIGLPANIASIILCSISTKKLPIRTIPITGLCISIAGIILGIAILACSLASSNFA